MEQDTLVIWIRAGSMVAATQITNGSVIRVLVYSILIWGFVAKEQYVTDSAIAVMRTERASNSDPPQHVAHKW